MKTTQVYKTGGPETILSPLETDREWMHENKYGYNCFPITLPNKMGFAISFPKDISFIWHGSNKQGPDGDIEILSGEEHCYFERGGGVIGFPTNLVFKTQDDLSIVTMPVPNQFIDGAQCFTSILSSSFYTGALHVVWKVTSPNKIITIKAGTPVAAVLPISLKEINNVKAVISENSISDTVHDGDYVDAMTKYGMDNMRTSDWYKKGIDHKGNIIGKHEITSFKFEVEGIN